MYCFTCILFNALFIYICIIYTYRVKVYFKGEEYHMELLQLRYFQVVARKQHMTKASECLNISQSSLSKTIASLEKELGVKLFDRKCKCIELNEFGKIFLKRIDDALLSIETGKMELNESISSKQYEIKLLVLSATLLVADVLEEFYSKYPNVKFNISKSFSTDENINDYDFIITSSYNKLDSNCVVTLLEEEIFLGCSKKHHLAEFDEISLNDTKDEMYVSLCKNKDLRKITDIICSKVDFQPNFILESEDFNALCPLIKAGKVLVFVPSISLKACKRPEYKLIRIKDTSCHRFISLAWQPDKTLSPSMELFKEHLINFFDNMSQ